LRETRIERLVIEEDSLAAALIDDRPVRWRLIRVPTPLAVTLEEDLGHWIKHIGKLAVLDGCPP
jgi:hypothetical protein